jgi:DNA-binding NarL/FixJ family response regulator
MDHVISTIPSVGALAPAMLNAARGAQATTSREPSVGSFDQNGDLEVIIVDERPLIRECLGRSLLVVEPALSLTYLSNADEFDGLGPESQGRPRVVLINISGSTDVDPVLAQVQHIKEIDPATSVIILSETESISNIRQAIEHGASGYIPVSVGLEVAVRAMQLAAAGGIYLPASVLSSFGQSLREDERFARQYERPISTFTSKQIAVIEALRRGKANKIIAYELNMCESTVKVHVRNVMKKLRAKNRTEVAYILNENVNGVFNGVSRDTR